jgi:general secretion pathway protein I
MKLKTSSLASQGFTLIEVLISLAILAIALTAIIKATTQTIRDTLYLENKTAATWVATQIINEARVGLLNETTESKLSMLYQEWPWALEITPTPNQRIKKLTVNVFDPQTQEELIELESYLYAP